MSSPLGRVVVGVLAAFVFNGCFQIASAQGSAPGAPSNFSASVNGQSVTLTWTAPSSGGAPSNYVLDAGTAAGLSNVGSFPVGHVTSVTVTAPNGTYFVRVRATNVIGSSPPSNEITLVVGTVIQPPGIPQSLQSTVNGLSVTLTWQAPLTGGAPSGYVLDVGTTSGASNIGSFPVGLVTTFAAVAAPGTYFVRVRASNAAGASGPSNEATIVVGGATAPGVPQNLQFTVSAGIVTLMWGAPTSGGPPSGYLIDVGTSAGGTQVGTFPQPNVTTMTAPAPPGTYFVRVRAQNASGTSGPSNEVVITVGATPTDINGTWNGSTSQGFEFSFIVANNQVTTTIMGGNFGSCSSTSQTSGLSAAVSPGPFSFSVPTSPGSIGGSVTGTFASATSASGSATLTATPIVGVGGCSGTQNVTWTASNAGPGMSFRPGQPRSVTANVSGTQVTLNWQASAIGGTATSYSIEIGTASGANNAGTFSSTTTSFTTTLPAGNYFARVKAVNGSGTSAPSSEVTFTITSGSGSAPTNLVASVTGSSVLLIWSPPTSGPTPTGYRVEIGTSSGASNVVDVAHNSTSYVNGSLGAGVYFARVKATTASGTSGPSNEVTFTLASGTNLNGTWLGTTNQGLEFSFIVENSRVTTTLMGGQFGSCSATSLRQFVNASVSVGTFSFTLPAVIGSVGGVVTGTFASGTSASGSASLTATPVISTDCSGTTNVTWTATNAGVGVPFRPGPPYGVGAGPLVNQIQLTWFATPAGGTPTSYSVEVGTSSGASDTATYTTTATTFTTPSLPPGTYFVRVRAVNASGTSAPSEEKQVTLAAPPGAPVNLVASLTGLTVTLNWSAPASGPTPTGYRVEIGTSSGASNTINQSNATTQYTNSSLADGTYYARVKATNAGGSGPASNEVTFTIDSSPGGNFNGNWNGTTSDNRRIAFTISGDRLTFLGGGAQILSFCSVETIRSNLTTAVVQGRVSYSSSIPNPGVGLAIVANFTSSSAASGTLRTTSNSPGCVGTRDTTWTATNAGVGEPFVPNSPSGLTHSFTGGGVNFTWAEGSGLFGGASTSYDIEIGTTSGASNTGVFSSTTTNYQKNDLTPGTYFARVRGRNDSGVGLPSTEITFTVLAPPNAPGTLTFTVDTTFVNLNWTAPTGGATVTGYTVEFGTSPGASDLTPTQTSQLSTSRAFTGAASQGTYYARVRARNGTAVGPPSNEVVFALQPGFTSIGSITKSGSIATVNWTAPSFGGPVTEYQIEVVRQVGPVTVLTTTVAGSARSYDIQTTGFANGGYNVYVTARNPYGAGSAGSSSFVIP